MSRNKTWFATWVAAGCSLAVILTIGAGSAATAATPPSPAPSAAVAAAMQALTTAPAQSVIDAIPADFVSIMGYWPVVVDSMAVNPAGGCSSPIPLPAEFDSSCKAHDLGYDLLRYASATGVTVDSQWRRDIDSQLSTSMRQACAGSTNVFTHRSCTTAASVAALAVDINSVRQGYAAPVPEPALPLIAGGSAALVIMSGIPLFGRKMRLPDRMFTRTSYGTVTA